MSLAAKARADVLRQLAEFGVAVEYHSAAEGLKSITGVFTPSTASIDSSTGRAVSKTSTLLLALDAVAGVLAWGESDWAVIAGSRWEVVASVSEDPLAASVELSLRRSEPVRYAGPGHEKGGRS